jgi:hypothetical protein
MARLWTMDHGLWTVPPYLCAAMKLTSLYDKALRFEFLSIEEGMYLFENAPLTDLMYVADEFASKECLMEK